jgi:hypothetical protein
LVFGCPHFSAYFCIVFLPRRSDGIFLLSFLSVSCRGFTMVDNGCQFESGASQVMTSVSLLTWVDNGCRWLTAVEYTWSNV